MADNRKIFPTAQVLELVAGKNDGDTREVASYIMGRPVTNAESAKTAAPFAAAWLARWYPKFMDLDWHGDGNWKSFVAQVENKLGANLSITPISGRLKDLANQALDALKDAHESLLRQMDAAAKLEEKVREMEPLASAMKTLQKKNDELEQKLKTMKTDMGALQRKVNEFQGKLAIDNSELMQTIKSAIKDGLKGMAVAAPVAGAESAAGSAAPAAAAPVSEEDEWDMPKSTSSEDEWG